MSLKSDRNAQNFSFDFISKRKFLLLIYEIKFQYITEVHVAFHFNKISRCFKTNLVYFFLDKCMNFISTERSYLLPLN